MRLSGDPGSQHYWLINPAMRDASPKVLLGDVVLEHVVDVDDEEGWAVVQVWENGRPKIDPQTGSFKTRLIEGPVRIVAENFQP